MYINLFTPVFVCVFHQDLLKACTVRGARPHSTEYTVRNEVGFLLSKH